MVFNSNVFLLAFLPIVFTAFWLARTKQQRYVILTVSGYVFYGWWTGASASCCCSRAS